jgi:amidase
MTELHLESLAGVCRRIKSGELTAVQVADYTLDRIARLDGRLHAFAMVTADQALARAAELDADRAAGKPLGALHGVPVAVKDLLWTEGLATASGTRVMRDFVPAEDATVIARLRRAGAVIIGKSQLTEGAFSMHHPDIEAPVNPWHAERWSGVSSSGSGVSVAAGLAFGALGTDTGGSIRFPSAACGLVGIKPTYGRVSRFGAFPLAESLDHIGPMTRSVEDAARMLQVIAGADPRDPTTLPGPVPNYVTAGDSVRGTVVAVDWEYVSSGVDASVVDTVREAVGVLESLGASIREVRLPASVRELVAGWVLTCARECAAAHKATFPARRNEYGPALEGLIDLGLTVDDPTYARLETLRAQFRSALQTLFGEVDLLIAPAMVGPTPTLDAFDAVVRSDDEVAAFITFTAPFDYSGHPTITLPFGLDADGMPRSFQLIAPLGAEAALIRAGSAFERAVGRLDYRALDARLG